MRETHRWMIFRGVISRRQKTKSVFFKFKKEKMCAKRQTADISKILIDTFQRLHKIMVNATSPIIQGEQFPFGSLIVNNNSREESLL